MKACLLVMNVRDEPRCLEAFRALDIDQAWFRGFREWDLAPEIFSYVARTSYDFYILAADDLVPTQQALGAVLSGLERHRVFTGWCNMSPGNSRANVRTKPNSLSRPYFVVTHIYPSVGRALRWVKDRTFEDPGGWPEGDFRVYSTGFAFTGMVRDLWLRFPLALADGSDFLLSLSLERAGVEVFTNREAFFYHLASKAHFVIGAAKPEVLEIRRIEATV